MWLIDTATLELEEFPDERNVKYAILSHRWEGKEVSFKDHPLKECSDPAKVNSLTKITNCCLQAQKDGWSYVWIDTCCIDKSSSAELQEAINSMFRWYRGAKVCYAYLSDFRASPFTNGNSRFQHSQWFKRGWTLQELIAPNEVVFLDSNWQYLGTRQTLSKSLANITMIDRSILRGGFPSLESGERPPICDITSWARGRETTRLEDRAYSLMGLFDVNMPMLYGEGAKAFIRLQEEILRNFEDQTLFAHENHGKVAGSCFATSPDQYSILVRCQKSNEHLAPSRTLSSYRLTSNDVGKPDDPDIIFGEDEPDDAPYISLDEMLALNKVIILPRPPHILTVHGVTIHVLLIPWRPYLYLAVLNTKSKDSIDAIGIFVMPLPSREGQFVRATHPYAKVHRMSISYSRSIQAITLVKRPFVVHHWLIPRPLPLHAGFLISIDEMLWSDLEAVHYSQWSSGKQGTYPTLPADGRTFHIHLKDGYRRGLLAKIQFRPLEPVLQYQVLTVQLAFLGDFNPHCFVSLSSSEVVDADTNLTRESDGYATSLTHEYRCIFGSEHAKFVPYQKELDWSGKSLRIDHHWNGGQGEILSNETDGTLCLRGGKLEHYIPMYSEKVLAVRVLVGRSEQTIELEIEIESPQALDRSTLWDCRIRQV